MIQPFDSGKFDKRFDDVFAPAIKEAGLEAYRVDRDPNVEVPIEAIEDGIKNAAICLADITTDNPNVWYELGYAFASGRPVVMVCSEERTTHRYPFDIQHRTVLNYSVEAPSDFERLRAQLSEKLMALLSKKEALRQIVESEQVAPTHGLSQPELVVLAILAGDTGLPGSSSPLYSLKRSAERSGLTSIGFSLAFRRLLSKGLIETIDTMDEHGESYEAARLTDHGWHWVERNESLFVLKKGPKPTGFDDLDDDIPF
ncbi:MAG: nucleoside 2-deoxyribosyltransferase [Thermoanaerobaculales bacterium]|nr:nucleoside 2-deoxyribosyltransferase [Thermoanaerobaculales bacterium]